MKTESENLTIKPIAHIRTDFKEKFGIPRQSGLSPTSAGEIVFEPEYRNPDAVRGIEGFSFLWLIFGFSESPRQVRSLTVRPPRLGGNERVGVFASRSPFRPNGLGLSSVKLLGICGSEKDGLVLRVSGADLLDGTPIYDIKPYLPYSDCHAEAQGGYAEAHRGHVLDVSLPDGLLGEMGEKQRAALTECLAQDPRPSYIEDDDRVYSMRFADYDIRFKVCGNCLTVIDAEHKV